MRTMLVTAIATCALLAAGPLPGQSRPATTEVPTGPNHRPGAPFRAKLSPPLAEGTVLLVSGHVSDGAGNGIPGAILDAWQADASGHYDTDGFEYRARVTTDEDGYFEIETVVPSNYGPPPHIHMIVHADGYRATTTEMLFLDKEHPRSERPELTPKLVERSRGDKKYLEGTFDVVLRRGA